MNSFAPSRSTEENRPTHPPRTLAATLIIAFGTLVFTTLLLTPLVLLPDSAWGWVAMYVTIALVLGARGLRDPRDILPLVLALAAHELVAAVNAFGQTVIGADKDAIRFFSDAVSFVRLGNCGWALYVDEAQTYTQLLATILRATHSSSLFVVEQLSIVSFVLSMLVLLKVATRLGVHKGRSGLILIYGVIPSALILCSVTLREPLQMLFVLLMVHWSLKLRFAPGIRPLAFLLFFAAMTASLHHGLALFAMFAVVAALTWAYGGRARRSRIFRRLFFLAIGIGGVILVLRLQVGGASNSLAALREGNSTKYVDMYRESLHNVDGRTNYAATLDSSSILSMMLTFPGVVISYMFEPFPWHVQTLSDVVACAESMLRFLLVFFAVRTLMKLRGEARQQQLFLLVLLGFCECLWALGTVNWGTAIRHHLPTYGLLVLAGGPGLLRAASRMSAALFFSRPPASHALARPVV